MFVSSPGSTKLKRGPAAPKSLGDAQANTAQKSKSCTYIHVYILHNPPTRPSPRQGRRLGPPEVWNLLCHGHGLHIVQGRSCNKCLSVFKRFAKLQRPHLPAHSPLLLRHSSLPFARLKPLKPLKRLKPSNSLAAASTQPSGRQPLLHLPAHSPLLLRHSSLPFARLQTLKTLKALKTLQFPRGSFHQALWPSAFAVPALQPVPAHSALLLGHSSLSCHQALWPSAFAVPGLQPALWLHIPRGSFHQAPGPQRSSIAACPLPARSPLLLGHSSLPFARLQTLKTLKTLQFPRGSFHQALWPSAFAAFACT